MLGFKLPKKAIICLAPHTSNWDFFIGQLYAEAEGLRGNFLMKKEWFIGPLGLFSQTWRHPCISRQAYKYDR